MPKTEGREAVGFALDPHLSSSTPSSRRDDFQAAMLGKLRFAALTAAERGWTHFVVAGDFFDTSDVSNEFSSDLYEVIRAFPCRVYALAGNHDQRFRRMDYLKKRPLGVLFSSGLVLDMVEHAGDFEWFVGMHYSDRPEPPTAPRPGCWLVCHQYVGASPTGWQSDEKGWLTHAQIDAAGYAGVVAGHDHVEYPAETTPAGAVIMRFGALSRGTKHEHNLTRTPKLAEVVVGPGCVPAVNTIDVPCSSDPFKESALAATALDSNMRSFVQAMGSGAFKRDAGAASPSESLKKLAADEAVPQDVVDRVLDYFVAAGVP